MSQSAVQKFIADARALFAVAIDAVAHRAELVRIGSGKALGKDVATTPGIVGRCIDKGAIEELARLLPRQRTSGKLTFL